MKFRPQTWGVVPVDICGGSQTSGGGRKHATFRAHRSPAVWNLKCRGLVLTWWVNLVGDNELETNRRVTPRHRTPETLHLRSNPRRRTRGMNHLGIDSAHHNKRTLQRSSTVYRLCTGAWRRTSGSDSEVEQIL